MVDKYKLNKLKLARLKSKLKEYVDVKYNTILLKSNHFGSIRNDVLLTYNDLSKKLIDTLNKKYEEFIKQIDIIENDFNNEINSTMGESFEQKIEHIEKMDSNKIDTSELNTNIDAIQSKINSLNKIRSEIQLYKFKSNEIEIDVNFNLSTIEKKSDVNVGASTSKQACSKSTTNGNGIYEAKSNDKKRHLSNTDTAKTSSTSGDKCNNNNDDDCKFIKAVKRKKNKQLKSNIGDDRLFQEKMSKVINKIINYAETSSSSEEEFIDYLSVDSDNDEKSADVLVFNESDSDDSD
jgi:hypothetical protein